MVATASADRTIRVWDAATGQSVSEIRGHDDAVTSIAYSRDGKLLISASADRTARVWVAATGVEIVRLSGHESGLLSAAFSSDGERVVTSSNDKTARVWRLPPSCNALISAARAVLPRELSSLDRKRYFLEEKSEGWLNDLYTSADATLSRIIPRAGATCHESWR
jgi:WD40 repeat protein